MNAIVADPKEQERQESYQRSHREHVGRYKAYGWTGACTLEEWVRGGWAERAYQHELSTGVRVDKRPA
jgi:hypothetical protein